MTHDVIHARKPGFEVRLCNPAIEQPFMWNEAKTHFVSEPKPTCPECIKRLKVLKQLSERDH